MKLYGSVKATAVPMTPSINLRIELPNLDNESLLPVTGKLRYITDRTRPDLLVSLGEISTGGADGPSDNHVKVAQQIYSYLKQTATDTLTLGGSDGGCIPFGFCDASYITTGNCRSRLGGCVYDSWDSGAIYSFSKNDTTTSHSSTEAEIKALDELIKVMKHIDDLRAFLGFDRGNVPMTIYCDNKSCIELCKTLKTTANTRHVNMRINYIRDAINERLIQIIFVPTHLNVADILTKPLAKDIFTQHKMKLLYGFNNDKNFLTSKPVINFTMNECNKYIQEYEDEHQFKIL